MSVFFQVWVFHYESCHVLPLCPYHNHFWKNFVELFYHDDTVDGGCVWQVAVDNNRNHVVHDIDNYYMVFFSLKRFFGVTIFWPMGDK